MPNSRGSSLRTLFTKPRAQNLSIWAIKCGTVKEWQEAAPRKRSLALAPEREGS